MMVVVHRWPILERGKGDPKRTKAPTETRTLPGQLQARGRVQLLFGMGDWRDFWSEAGTPCEKAMSDWVIDTQSLREIQQWRIIEKQTAERELRKGYL